MARYADIADLPGWVHGVSAEDLERALDHASVTADGYLAAQFTLPITAWGKDLRHHTAIAAAYDVLSDRGFNPDAEGNANIRARYEDAIAWFKQVANGTVSPQGITDSAPPEDVGMGPMVLYPKLSDDRETMFTSSTPKPRGF